MPAVVFAAPYTDRSARVVCLECSTDDAYDRTAPAQEAARAHNLAQHPARALTFDLEEPR